MLLRMSVTILLSNNVTKHFRFLLWLTLLHVIVYRFDLEQEISYLYNLCVRSAFVIVTSVFFVFFQQENEAVEAPKVKKSPGRPKGSRNKRNKVCLLLLLSSLSSRSKNAQTFLLFAIDLSKK